jgi:hypothetical protein
MEQTKHHHVKHKNSKQTTLRRFTAEPLHQPAKARLSSGLDYNLMEDEAIPLQPNSEAVEEGVSSQTR